ncbi:MAG: O-antigen ligase family protein [Sulfurifustis sp.]
MIAKQNVAYGRWLLLPAAAGTLLFTGRESWLLAFATALILIWLTLNLARRTDAPGNRERISVVDMFMALFWLWLFASICWSRAPAESAFQVWPAVLFIAVCWAYLLESDATTLWRYVGLIGVALAVILASLSCFQHFLLGHEARSIFVTRNSHAAFLDLVLLTTFTYSVQSAADDRAPTWRRRAMYGLLLLFSFALVLTTSRGATLALLLALAVAGIVLGLYKLARHAVWPAMFVLTGFALAQVPLNANTASLAQRLSSSETGDRLIIWTNAWRMLVETPWAGVGVGIYPLAWPPYKSPADPSSGFFVHNDYLQLWIDAGIVGLILFIAIGICLFLDVWRTVRSPSHDGAARIEIVGLASALLALAAHSFVDFNFHVPAIMLAAGLVLGRLRQLVGGAALRLDIGAFAAARRRAIVAGTGALALAVLYLFTYGTSDVLAKAAVSYARRGDLDDADRTFRQATLLGAANDRVLTSYADFIRQVLRQIPATEAVERKRMFDHSLHLLDRVEHLNPLRWDAAVIRAKLFQDNSALAGPDWLAASTQAYRHALALNPWFYDARADLAALLIKSGDPQAATRELAAGLDFAYAKTPAVLRYYAFTAAVQEQWGTREQTEKTKQMSIALGNTLLKLNGKNQCPLPARLWNTC